MTQTYNFSAGPAMLPRPVLERIQEELFDWHLGSSVMEISHRHSKFVHDVVERSNELLRELMNIPKNYKILFLPDGARAQFAAVPMNLLQGKQSADYIDTGIWSRIAISEAKKYCQVNVVASNQDNPNHTIPPQSQWQIDEKSAYLHYTPNETISGVEFHWVPENVSSPLVVDMSSSILSRPIDVSKFGVIYACGQKNLGIAGVTVVIVREDLLAEPMTALPSIFSYQLQAEHHSLYNTPPTFPWYVAKLVFEWLIEQGGVEPISKLNQEKSDSLYAAIDASDFYVNRIDPECRSRMNVTFNLPDAKLEKQFLEMAEQEKLTHLKGHKLLGGIRASIYNAMPKAGVDSLIEFMETFEKQWG